MIPISALSLVLGFMVMMASITDTNRTDRLNLLGASQQARVGIGPLDLQDQYVKMSDEVKTLRAENDKLQKALGDRNSSTKVLNEGLEQAKAFAGLTDVQGPGLKVTLTDSTKSTMGESQIEQTNAIIHDMDILKVTNELFAAGAEAIDVNGHRIVTTSSFRCVGPVIQVDGVPVASPVVVRAIGDPGALEGGLNLPGGVLSLIRMFDPNMVQIEQVKEMRIGAYGGSTETHFAKAVEGK
ncbi:MAG TPA: DUF881 domain-containing protein [Fimbriimonadaceae bacterium]|nr:DUF881 domain-containing protein [Fimbriimonadaceae bacterium]